MAFPLGNELIAEKIISKVELNGLLSKDFQELADTAGQENEKFNKFISVLQVLASFNSKPVGIQNFIKPYHELISENSDILIGLSNDALEKEIEASDLQNCLKILKELKFAKSSSVNKLIQIKLNLAISNILNIFANQASDEEEEVAKTIKNIYTACKRGVKISMDLAIVISMSCDYLIHTYNLDPSRSEKVEISENAEKILRFIEIFPLPSGVDFSSRFQEIENSIKSREVQKSADVCKPVLSKIPSFELPKPYYKSHNSAYTVKFYKVETETLNFIIKEYTKFSNEMRNIIQHEVSLMEQVSHLKKSHNCFLEIYESEFRPSCIRIHFESHPWNLEELIGKLKKSKEFLSETKIEEYTHSLLSCFAELESMQIHHLDIKPQNVLVTRDMKLKITNFSAWFMKLKDLDPVQIDKESYLAPEIIEVLLSKNKSGRFKLGLSDVFSLGLVLFEMATLQSVRGLNKKANHHLLMAEVNKITAPSWMPKLLKKMLALDYHDRLRFRKLFALVCGAAITTSFEI